MEDQTINVVKMEIETEQPRIINIVTAKGNKKVLPELYNEIYGCYKAKDYSKCLTFIDEIEEENIEYQILKSACFIHSGTKISEAHKILNDVLEKHPENAYTIYAKGLAFYHEEKWSESMTLFDKARILDASPNMERAEIMMDKAQAKLSECERQIKRSESMLQVKTSPSGSYVIRRFGCELCNHFFGKKFNLDRHNRSIHKRSTPHDFPTNPNAKSSSSTSPVAVSATKEEKASPRPILKREIKTGCLNSSLLIGVKRGRVKCDICKKMFKKGSIARHVIIHTGNKSHKCNECDMAFFQKSDLARHEAIHSEELNFECDMCDRRFRIKKNLQVHKRRHHSVQASTFY